MKTKSIILTTLVFILSSVTLTVHAGSETRPVSAFQEVEVSTGIDVIYSTNSSYSLKVEAEENIMAKVKTEVKNGVLKIYVDNTKNNRNRGNITVYISAPTLDRISASSGSSFITKEISNPKTIKVDISSGANTKIDKLTANQYYLSVSSGAGGYTSIITSDAIVSISSGASFKLDGKTKNITVHASSGANANIKGLTYETIDSHLSSGGSISK